MGKGSQREIKNIVIAGGFLVWGHSIGGTIAHEAAKRNKPAGAGVFADRH